MGTWSRSFGGELGFALSAGSFRKLRFPLASDTKPSGINDAGDIAGTFVDTSNVNHGFVYSDGTWFRVDVAGAQSTDIFRIKNNGIIVGDCTNESGELQGIWGR